MYPVKARLSASAIVLCVSILCGASAQQQTSRGIAREDYYAFEFVSDPQVSPDGRLIAYVVTKVDLGQNRRTTSIWMATTDGSQPPWQFTTSPQSSSSPLKYAKNAS